MTDGVSTVQVNGVRLAYRTWGADTRNGTAGTPVVLLHGLGGDGEDWRGPLVSHLAAAHPVHALDLRGHGRSEWPGEYGLEQLRDDVAGFVDVIGAGRVLLIGHSYGSVVAWLFAQEYPARVERLVLEETTPMLPLDPPAEVPERPTGPQDFDREVRTQFVRQRNNPDPSWWERLTAITAPTLVVGGGPDSHLSQDDLAAVAGRIPRGRLVTIEGGGHLVHEERPKEFAAAVQVFLAE